MRIMRCVLSKEETAKIMQEAIKVLSTYDPAIIHSFEVDLGHWARHEEVPTNLSIWSFNENEDGEDIAYHYKYDDSLETFVFDCETYI